MPHLNKTVQILLFLTLFVPFTGCHKEMRGENILSEEGNPGVLNINSDNPDLIIEELRERSTLVEKEQKKIFYVNSYHEGYAWSDDIEETLFHSLDKSGLNYELRLFRMDTKLNKSDEHARIKAGEALEIIEEFQPDIILGSDDSFVKYLVVPYLKDKDIPVLFCAVNWDASQYGLPLSHIRGMVEVDPMENTVAHLSLFTEGNRLGLLFQEEEMNHTIYKSLVNRLELPVEMARFAPSFSEWKKYYQIMQNETDMLVLFNTVGLKDWNEEEALRFIEEETRVPVAVSMVQNIHLALLGETKVSREFAWWLAQNTIKILEGTPPDSIPMSINRESKLVLNTTMANKLGYKFPYELIEEAQLWPAEGEGE